MSEERVVPFPPSGVVAELDLDAGMGEAAPRGDGGPTPWTTTADLGATVVPFRRPKSKGKLRRARRSAWSRWLWPFLAACLIVAMPVAFVAWLLTGPSFKLASLEVEPAPAGRVAPAWVRRALSPYAGENLWRLDLGVLERRLAAHPWIADVGLRKRPPSTLVVRLVERREAALYRAETGLAWVDRTGRVIEPVDLSRTDPALDLPILSGPPESIPAALDLLGEIHDAGPGWAAGLSEIEILGPEDFRLHTTALPFPVIVRQGSLPSKARHLRALLPRLAPSFGVIDAVDLRFARRIIIQQAAPRGRSEEQRA